MGVGDSVSFLTEISQIDIVVGGQRSRHVGGTVTTENVVIRQRQRQPKSILITAGESC
jgi:hypothetical protein